MKEMGLGAHGRSRRCMDTQESHFEHLRQQAIVEEKPFESGAPLVGSLIVWVRRAWNSVATKWYVRPLLQQQNEVNQLLVDSLVEQAARSDEQAAQWAELDQAQTAALRNSAEITAQVRQLNQRLRGLEARLDALENAHDG